MKHIYQCDSCDHERSGDTKKELMDRGWSWHSVKGGWLVVCDECEDRYEQRRLGKAKAA